MAELSAEQKTRLDELIGRVQIRRFALPWPRGLEDVSALSKHFCVQLGRRFTEYRNVPTAFWVFARRDPVTQRQGNLVFIVEPNLRVPHPDDNSTKDLLSAVVRSMCERADVAAVVTTSEAWISLAPMTPEGDAKVARMDREGTQIDPNRQEVVLLVVEARNGTHFWQAPIVRPVGASEYLEAFQRGGDHGVGRFTGFLREVQ